ncbi:hypothetical protein [Cerasicoccus frondis]|uniref:hypothetical protein n=1 Tax=Cerasicoccus frondis TaxID=490090 RepID=UPI0028529517|nr:hypothetical protein [Cerasicoccus frondis]
MKFLIILERKSRFVLPKDPTGKFRHAIIEGFPQGVLAYLGRFLTAQEFVQAINEVLKNAKIKNAYLKFLAVEVENPEIESLRNELERLQGELDELRAITEGATMEPFDDSLVDYQDDHAEEPEEPEPPEEADSEESEPTGFNDPAFWKELSKDEVSQYVQAFEPTQLREVVQAVTGQKIDGRKSIEKQQTDAVDLLCQNGAPEELDL